MDPEFGEMLDTSPENRRRYYELLRTLTPEQRARKVVGLCRAVRRLALAGIRERHPGATDEEESALLAERLYGTPTAERLFPTALQAGHARAR
jgi:hypothetical protein